LPPSSARSRAGVANLDRLFASGYSESPTGQATLSVSASSKTDEGRFVGAETTMLLAETTARIQQKKGGPWSSAKKLAMVLGLIGGLKEDGGAGFAVEYYLPYFKALAAEKLAEAFAYVAMQSSGSPDVKEWLTNNQGQIEKLLAWSKTYAWPSPKL